MSDLPEAIEELRAALGRWNDGEGVLFPSRQIRAVLAAYDATAGETGEWMQAAWAPTLLMPKLWAEDTIPPDDRGTFATIHCSSADLAAQVARLLNAVAAGSEGTTREPERVSCGRCDGSGRVPSPWSSGPEPDYEAEASQCPQCSGCGWVPAAEGDET